mmetsp:Transcript_18618/g.24061  ORF Transcript_18618/g.24061 Transcript_18618/m.24061 type:complete len:94 (-) Transcript_18618:784-1065(-)
MSSAKYFGIPDCSKTKDELLALPLSLKSPLPIEHFTILLDYVELMLKMKDNLLNRLRFTTSTLDEKIIAWFMKRTHFKYIPTDKGSSKKTTIG